MYCIICITEVILSKKVDFVFYCKIIEFVFYLCYNKMC